MWFREDIVPIFFEKQWHLVVVCASRLTLLPDSDVCSDRLWVGGASDAICVRY